MSNEYKPILPSTLLQHVDPKQFSYVQKTYNNSKLRVGVVLEVIERDAAEDANNHGLGPEYSVLTIEQDGGNGVAPAEYKNCISLDSFGGVADFMEYKRRPPKDQQKVRDEARFKDQVGSLVLVLCQDGVSDKGIIIGGIGHPNRETTLTKENGHHLEGEFNGLNWQINKDGELKVTFKSATDAEGTPADEEAGGSSLTISKDGSLEVSDGNKESIKIDKTAKTVTITAEADIAVTTDANFLVTAKESVSLDATSDLLAKAGGSATLESGGSFTIKADGELEVDAKGVMVKSGGPVTIKGTIVEVDAPIIMLGKGGTPALTLSTQFLGTGNLGIPVISQAIGPFSSSVFIGS